MNDERTTESLEGARERYDAAREEETRYTPRPRLHVVMAWVLLAIVVLGVLNICYMQITA